MVDDEDIKPRKEREPISLVCLVVLIVASVAVIGAFVNDNILNGDNDAEAASGSTVEVDYTGAFYDYYDGEGNGAIFQTTVKDIADSTSYIHSAGYVEVSSYSAIKFTVGSGNYLSGFENAVIGKKAGDTVKVVIPAGQGYNAADTTKTIANNGFEVPVQQKMSAAEYKTLYGEDATDGTSIKTLYGWDANVTKNADGTIVLTNMASNGRDYDIESGFATVKIHVDGIDAGKIKYTLSVTDCVAVDGKTYSDFHDSFDGNTAEYSAVKMVRVPMYDATASKDTGNSFFVYIIGLGNDGSFEYRTVEEKYNIDLYFTIKVVSVS